MGATYGDELAMPEYKYSGIIVDREYLRISNIIMLPWNSFINLGWLEGLLFVQDLFRAIAITIYRLIFHCTHNLYIRMLDLFITLILHMDVTSVFSTIPNKNAFIFYHDYLLVSEISLKTI